MSGSAASEVAQVSASKLCKTPPCQTLLPLGNLLSLSSKRRRELRSSWGSVDAARPSPSAEDAPPPESVPRSCQYKRAVRTLSRALFS